jgi:hypothetical protein
LEEILPNGTQACMAAGLRDKADTESLMLAFDSNEKPIVGQQVTMTWRAPNVGAERLSLILGQANTGNCDVIAWGRKHGYLYRDGRLLRDDGRTVALDEALRRERALTYTAVPRRDGRGSSVDRDGDGFLNGIEERYRSNPLDPTDTPRRH